MEFLISVVLIGAIVAFILYKNNIFNKDQSVEHRPRSQRYFSEDSEHIGKEGELLVRNVLGYSSGSVKIFNDYKFISNNKSVQIDHICVNKNGIFVIETKHYQGKIYGSEHQQEWRQVLANGSVLNYFYNPVKQNKSHIYKLSKILPKNTTINSIIVFIDANIEDVEANNVCNLSQLTEILNTNFGETLSIERINLIADILEQNRNYSISNNEHIKQIHKMQEDIENNICPRCGAKLVLRNGKYGEFYGCSKYPKCKFKKKI